MDQKQLIGSRIKDLRKMRGYSQEKLAEIVGINEKYLSSIERGAENPTLDLFIRLAHGLNVDLREIFETEPGSPKVVRRKIMSLIDQAKDDQLLSLVRILEALTH